LEKDAKKLIEYHIDKYERPVVACSWGKDKENYWLENRPCFFDKL